MSMLSPAPLDTTPYKTMPHAKLSSGEFYYTCYENSPDKPWLCFLAGLAANHAIWLPLVESLREDFSILLFDNRDIGKSVKVTEPYTIQDLATDTAELLDALHIDRAHMVGHSMGGAILQQLLISYPEKVDKAVILASFARLKVPAALSIQLPHRLRKLGIPQDIMIEASIPWVFGHTFLSKPGTKEEITSHMAQQAQPSHSYKRQMDALLAFDVRKELHTIQSPTLILFGEEDLVTPPSYAKELHEHIKGAKLQEISKAGHMIQIEQPSSFVKALLSFLSE